MLFNSIAFIFFFPIVVITYFLLPYKYRWILLLAASYYFYMCWRVEYIVLILISTLVDYFVAIRMSEIPEKKKRRKWLYLSLLCNLGILFGFKYFNFVGDSINAFFNQFNIMMEVPGFNVLLPVGISFYTFQTLSYSIDVYNDKVKPERHLGIFALYVSFFPQLVAGPIERPDRLLPQFRQKFDFDYRRVVDGLKMMVWGFFMKLVIADRLAPFVEKVYLSPKKAQAILDAGQPLLVKAEGLEVIIATFFFAFQIFGDFAGYSIIAIGAAKVMGYDLMQNFRRPYFSGSIREFWQRWHISLSTWFRDYVYIPLGGNRVVKWRWYYNLFITFLISGLWHGANWTFVVWGALHGVYLVFAIVTDKWRGGVAKRIGLADHPKVFRGVQIFTTFILACLAWVFFRAPTVSYAFGLIVNMFKIDSSQFTLKLFNGLEAYELVLCFFFIGLMEFIHAWEEWGKQPTPLYSNSQVVRWVAYVTILVLILGFGVFSSSEFIYFQF